ncbi:hypothetical protein J2S74_002280 [Evansella vedderi]|uniref:Uncharacterized protein n=1 Tax=Evansella vedderi TaxID=38282 RepID=A0ABT9ZUH6_9BACI|nr:hypothetical protein [Evansella vedderi]MDQ0254898.1 hypothetical protein [Evansella vedderi]
MIFREVLGITTRLVEIERIADPVNKKRRLEILKRDLEQMEKHYILDGFLETVNELLEEIA